MDRDNRFNPVVCIYLAFAHWNLSRKPPYHKGPGSPGYVETSPTVETNQTSD